MSSAATMTLQSTFMYVNDLDDENDDDDDGDIQQIAEQNRASYQKRHEMCAKTEVTMARNKKKKRERTKYKINLRKKKKFGSNETCLIELFTHIIFLNYGQLLLLLLLLRFNLVR